MVSVASTTGVRIDGTPGNDRLIGTAADEQMYGLDGNDTLVGNGGNDTLIGGNGDDGLYGEDGDDILDGGSGRNYLRGGEGNDTYMIRSAADYTFDTGGVDSGIIMANWYKPNPQIENWTWADGVQKLPYWVDALTFAPAPQLGLDIAATRTVNYCFAQAPASYFRDKDKNGFTPFTDDQVSYTRKMFAYIESVLNVHFVETKNPEAAYTIVFGNNKQDNSGGYASMMSPTRGTAVMLNSTERTLAPSKDQGQAFLSVALHETGHALGLKHPFEHADSLGTIADGPYLPEAEENSSLTVMSYDQAPHNAAEYSPLDIAALQYLYGVAPSKNAGDTLYRLDGGQSVTISDGEGIDALDGSLLTASMTLYLEAGYWSHVGAKGVLFSTPGQITINFGTVIEDAYGGSGADLIVGNAGSNLIDGGAGDDVLEGADGGDLLAGGAGNDRLRGGSGDDRLDGGAGLDAAVYTGARAGFSITHGADGWVVTGSASDQGSDTLTGIERIVFGDGAIALDVDGVAAAAYRLYAAAFDRKPDLAGMGYWIKAMDQGISLQEVASAFARTDEFTQKYGATHTMESFLVKMYQNVLHRVPDQAGLEYWIGSMTGGTTEAEVLAAFSVSAENRAQVIGQIENGIEYVPFV